MRLRPWLIPLCVSLCVTPAAAQRTSDQARLVFSFGGGFVGGGALWRIDGQPMVDAMNAALVDTFRLERRLQSTLGVGFSGIYFPGPHLGLSGEIFLLGLGFEDRCTRTYASASTHNDQVCASIDGTNQNATAVFISGGGVYRVASQQSISPYLRGQVGLLINNQSTIRVEGSSLEPGGTEIFQTVFKDDKDTRINPGFLVGLGLTAPVARSYQLRWEIRENVVGLHKVTGRVLPRQGAEPPSKLIYKGLFSMTIGIDIVLERRRGRRY